MNHDVFISHSAKDKPIADAVCATLEAKGIRCWIAPRDILPGSDYGEAIIDAITQCRFMILVLSNNANQSRQIIREVERAVNKGVIIIPFRVEDVALSKSLEYFLATPHWLDAMTPPLEAHLGKLAETVGLLKNKQENTDHDLATGKTKFEDARPLRLPVGVADQSVDPNAKVLGERYSLGRKLEIGGIATVYLARDLEEADSRVVVKVLCDWRRQDLWAMRKSLAGIEKVDSPHIAKLLDSGVTADGELYLVQEYIDGVSLQSVMRPEGMHLQRAGQIIRQIAEGLGAAHQSNIYHGNLNPANFMLETLDCGDEQVKIINLEMVTITNALNSLHAMGMTLGTAAYIAPEILTGSPLSATSEVYTLGLVAYELLTGRRAFNPETMFLLLELMRNGVTVKPRSLRSSIPEPAQDVILKSLSYLPQDRYSDVRVMGEELAAALGCE